MTAGMLMYIIGGVFAAIAVIAAIGAVRQFIRRSRSKSWPIAAGRVTVSEVTAETRTETDSDNTRRQVTMYGSRIAYAYSVGGVAYEGHLVDWIDGMQTNMQGPARRVVEKYPVGQNVNVYYDPANPKMAVLEPWRMKGILFIVLLTVVFGIVGAVLLWFAPTAQ
jgi:hypothetical protein